MDTMKAAVVPALGASLEIQDLAVPDPGPGQVLVRMQASGICHTDIHAAHGDWPVKPATAVRPRARGHRCRGAGRRRCRGPAGRRAGGHRMARLGLRPLPLLRLRPRDVVRDPAEQRLLRSTARTPSTPSPTNATSFRCRTPCPLADAAPLTCAGVTTFAAIKAAEVRPGERVAVFGIGGLGHLALQYARLRGAVVIAVDVEDEKLDLAHRARRRPRRQRSA